MTTALYCPMKPPDHPVASGDREIGRLVLRLLEDLGEAPVLASRLSTWQGSPDPDRFAELERASAAEADRLIDAWQSSEDRPDAWVTYHLYHKAPDHLGPRVADALGLAYVVIEASRAKKRAEGPWAEGFRAADRALAEADAVCAMHETDRAGLAEIVPADRLTTLAPFIDTSPFAAIERGPRPADAPVRLLAVGMMRPGNKEACYRVLADAVRQLEGGNWHLFIAGDGEAADDLRPLFDPERTSFLGRLDRPELIAAYRDADIFVWPAVNEPFGLVFLEAQAAALPVVGGFSRGVPEIVRDGETGLLTDPTDAAAFARAITSLMTDPDRRARLAQAARVHAVGHHDVARARADLGAVLKAARARRGAKGTG